LAETVSDYGLSCPMGVMNAAMSTLALVALAFVTPASGETTNPIGKVIQMIGFRSKSDRRR